MKLAELIVTYRPGIIREGYDGDETWEERSRRLWKDDKEAMLGYLPAMFTDPWPGEPAVVKDGRVIDGHHRIVALWTCGRRVVDVPLTVVHTVSADRLDNLTAETVHYAQHIDI